jgi:outer membrane protein assembly factor BamD
MTAGTMGGRAVLALVAVAMLAGCSGLGSRSETPDLSAFTAEEIFRRGEFELEAGSRATAVVHYFSEIERLYPYSDWARRALIMQAYTHHRNRAYDESRAAAQRFLDLYPGDEDAAYAAYLLALSYYDQIDQIGRDQGVAFQALTALRNVIETYPDTEYARSAVLKFELVFNHLAGKEMEVGRYYLRRGNHAAAMNRFRMVVQNYATSTHTPEALHRLVEVYLFLGLEEEAQTAAAILGHNFRASPFYEESFRLLSGRGLQAEASGESWLRQIYRETIQGRWL